MVSPILRYLFALAASQAFPRNRRQPRSTTLPTRIVARIQIFEAKRSDRRDLRDVLAGFRPMEVWRIPWKDDDATRRISIHLIAVEAVAKPDVEDAGDDRVDAVFRMPM